MAPPALFAGGAFRYVHFPRLQEVHQHLASPPRQRDGQNVGRAAAQHSEFRNLGREPPDNLFPLQAHPLRIFPKPRPGCVTGRCEGRNLGGGFGSGPAALFLAAAEDHRLQAQAFSHVKRPDALRRVNLVPADADEVRPQAFGRKGDLQKGLHRIGVQQGGRARFLQQGRNGRNVRHGAGFVVHQHQRHQNRILPQGLAHGRRRDRPGNIRLQAGHFKSPRLQQVQRFADGVVFRGGADDVFAFPLHAFCPGKQRPVVALGTAGGKNQLLRPASQCFGNRCAGAVQEFPRLPSRRVGGAGISEGQRHRFHGGLRCFLADLRGGGIVKIMHMNSPLLYEVQNEVYHSHSRLQSQPV